MVNTRFRLKSAGEVTRTLACSVSMVRISGWSRSAARSALMDLERHAFPLPTIVAMKAQVASMLVISAGHCSVYSLYTL